jgi:VCBS repeat-containing protein
VMDGKTTITYSTTTARLRAGRTISPTFVVKDKDHKGAAGSVTVAVVTSSGSASGFYTIAAVTGGGGKS